jgi:hypothetical protein
MLLADTFFYFPSSLTFCALFSRTEYSDSGMLLDSIAPELGK